MVVGTGTNGRVRGRMMLHDYHESCNLNDCNLLCSSVILLHSTNLPPFYPVTKALKSKSRRRRRSFRSRSIPVVPSVPRRRGRGGKRRGRVRMRREREATTNTTTMTTPTTTAGTRKQTQSFSHF